MKLGKRPFKTQLKSATLTEGKSIEENMRIITANKEQPEMIRPLTYTERSEGVLPQYDMRCDKWDVAQEAAGKMAKSAIANGTNLEAIQYAKENKLPFKIEETDEE